MKRSEMIKKLVRIYETAPEGFSAYHICDILLGAAEREGMLPPLVHPIHHHALDQIEYLNGLVYTFSNDKISLYDYAKEVESLKEQLKKAEKVIEYYANPESWDFEEILDDVEFCEDPQAELGGKRARKYLFDKD